MDDNAELESLVLGDILRTRAETHRGETFLVFSDGELTFGEVDAMADRTARGLAARGVGRGDHVGIMLPNCPEFLYTVFAVARLGAVAVPVNVEYRGDMLRHVLASSEVSTLVIDGPYVERLWSIVGRLDGLSTIVVHGTPEVPVGRLGVPATTLSAVLSNGVGPVRAEVRFGDPQAIMYTSGTTGPSKGAIVPHALALTCALDSLDYLDRWGKTTYCPLPLFHAAGLWDGVLAALLSGSRIALVDRFSASRFWDDVRRFDAQVVMSVFSMIPIMLNQPPSPRDRDHPLETFYMGKSVLDAPLRERFGVRSAETYTSTEAGIATASPYGEWRIGSCGQPNHKRFDVAIVDEQDRVLGAGEPGELVVRPRQPAVITTGYYGRPEVTADCFRNLWYHTGDRMWRDVDGYYYFLDRMSDSIRRSGENISAFDIECQVNLHPAVLESAAFGIPSELAEEEVALAVVLKRGVALDAEELIAYCAQELPAFMLPRQVEFLDSLPRTQTNKIAKYLLREALSGSTGGARRVGPTMMPKDPV